MDYRIISTYGPKKTTPPTLEFDLNLTQPSRCCMSVPSRLMSVFVLPLITSKHRTPYENTSALADNCPCTANSGDMYPLLMTTKAFEFSHFRDYNTYKLHSKMQDFTSPNSSPQLACRIVTTHTDVMFLALTSPWSLRNRFPSPKSAILGFIILSRRMFPALMSPCAKIVWDSSCRNAKPVAVPSRISNLVLQSIVFLRSTCAKETNKQTKKWAHSYSNICLHSLVHWIDAVAQQSYIPEQNPTVLWVL